LASAGSYNKIYFPAMMRYRCSYCGVSAGHLCITTRGKAMKNRMHHARLQSITTHKIFGVKL